MVSLFLMNDSKWRRGVLCVIGVAEEIDETIVKHMPSECE